jgi:hypothetical protein
MRNNAVNISAQVHVTLPRISFNLDLSAISAGDPAGQADPRIEHLLVSWTWVPGSRGSTVNSCKPRGSRLTLRGGSRLRRARGRIVLDKLNERRVGEPGGVRVFDGRSQRDAAIGEQMDCP